MIPKIIHYCWFGRGEMPELVQNCITSWHTYMPDWEYRLWNEASLSQTLNMPTPNPSLEGGRQTPLLNPPTKGDEDWLEYMPAYVKEAYAAKKYAFVSDYVRLWALNQEGGLYMDVDFEVYKPFDDLMDQYDAFAGYEGSKKKPVMMGVMAAHAHHHWIQEMMETYTDRRFVKEDGSLDMTPNTGYFFDWMTAQGFIADGKERGWRGVHILPVEYFCPELTTGENLRCERTYCEHKGLHSWSGDGGWKTKLLGIFSPKIRTILIKLKRKILR